MTPFDNDNPRNWQEQYHKIAIFRVHYSIFEIRRCPICQKVIEDQQVEAVKEEANRYGFELK